MGTVVLRLLDDVADALVAGQETAAENNGVVLLPERVVFSKENINNYDF